MIDLNHLPSKLLKNKFPKPITTWYGTTHKKIRLYCKKIKSGEFPIQVKVIEKESLEEMWTPSGASHIRNL